MQEVRELAQIIGNVSQQLGLVLAPRFEQGIPVVGARSLGTREAAAGRHYQPKSSESLVMEVGSECREDVVSVSRWLTNGWLGLVWLKSARRRVGDSTSC